MVLNLWSCGHNEQMIWHGPIYMTPNISNIRSRNITYVLADYGKAIGNWYRWWIGNWSRGSAIGPEGEPSIARFFSVDVLTICKIRMVKY
jgi:hypothetical protein